MGDELAGEDLRGSEGIFLLPGVHLASYRSLDLTTRETDKIFPLVAP